MPRHPIRRALISVYDKAGVEELATGLAAAGVEIVSTGSTAARIADAGVAVTAVDALTGFPEILEGRVKTLHPTVHGGILADRRKPAHEQQLRDLGIAPFDLVVGNLYPFAETVRSGAGIDAVVEQIDIGGPAMVRAAAKNHASVAVVVNPARYADVLAAVDAGGFELAQRQELAAEAFAHTAEYDAAVATWMADVVVAGGSAQTAEGALPATVEQAWEKKADLRYGENPHQAAALYVPASGSGGGIAGARQLHGKEMSYNNYVDTDAALRAVSDFEAPAVAIIKHANPCGIAVAEDVTAAHAKAHASDPVSAYGGVIAVNRPVSVALAEQIAPIFTEVVAAPGFEDGALEVLAAKKNIRLLVVDSQGVPSTEFRQVSGGLLVQDRDAFQAAGDRPETWTLAAGRAADSALLGELEFAWKACRSVKSNAILLARDGASVGIGMGQVNRVDSCRLAVSRAGDERARGAVAASDAFFPFADGAQILIDAGVRAIVQPGGSIRDEETTAAADAAGVTMYLTGTRHFFH